MALNARNFSAAIQFGEHSLTLDQRFWVGYYQLAMAHEQMGNHELALDVLRQAGPLSNGNSKVIGLRGYVLAKLGRFGEAREVLNTLEALSRERYTPPYATALVYAGLGETELALEWLERAFDTHDVHLVLTAADPKWDSFRAENRFVALLDRCGFRVLDAARN